jgi:putative acetyltransferase
LEPAYRIVSGEIDGALAGFTVVDIGAGYLDQIVVGERAWGSGLGRALMSDAKAACPDGLRLDVNKDNARAVAFYAREGFVVTGETVNPRSGLPVLKLEWTP